VVIFYFFRLSGLKILGLYQTGGGSQEGSIYFAGFDGEAGMTGWRHGEEEQCRDDPEM